jgi:hypothetical protein
MEKRTDKTATASKPLVVALGDVEIQGLTIRQPSSGSKTPNNKSGDQRLTSTHFAALQNAVGTNVLGETSLVIPSLRPALNQETKIATVPLQERQELKHEALKLSLPPTPTELLRPVGNTKKGEYCMWQCGLHICCPDGKLGIDRFHVISDTRGAPEGKDDPDDVTFATVGTPSRLSMVDGIVATWPGPKVFVFGIWNYSSQTEKIQTANAELADLRKMALGCTNSVVVWVPLTHLGDEKNGNRSKYDLYTQVLLERMAQPAMPEEEPFPLWSLFPINTLRNVAADLAATRWIFAVDIDFAPASTLYPRLTQVYIPGPLSHVQFAAIVVPHFEYKLHMNLADGRRNVPIRTPTNFSSFEELVKSGLAAPFECHTGLLSTEIKWNKSLNEGFHHGNWCSGIDATRNDIWWAKSKSGNFGLQHISVPFERQHCTSLQRSTRLRDAHSPCMRSEFWEPYVVIRRQEKGGIEAPRYIEDFVGRK